MVIALLNWSGTLLFEGSFPICDVLHYTLVQLGFTSEVTFFSPLCQFFKLKFSLYGMFYLTFSAQGWKYPAFILKQNWGPYPYWNSVPTCPTMLERPGVNFGDITVYCKKYITLLPDSGESGNIPTQQLTYILVELYNQTLVQQY